MREGSEAGHGSSLADKHPQKPGLSGNTHPGHPGSAGNPAPPRGLHVGRDLRAAPPPVEVCVPRPWTQGSSSCITITGTPALKTCVGAGRRLPGVSNRLRKPRFHAVNSPQVRAAGPWAGKLRAGGLG